MNLRKPITQLVLLACFAIIAQAAYAQRAPAAGKHILGSRTVRIPAPAGFIDVVPRFDSLTDRFIATEAPENEVLAVHVPRSLVPRLEKGDEPDLEFYTKVSVSKRLKTVEATPELFAEVVKVYKKTADTLLDPKGPLLTSVVKNAGKGLKEHWGEDTGFNITEPKNLGYFDHRPTRFSSMMLMKVENFGTTTPMLVSLSWVLVNKRLIFVYGYRQLVKETDAATLRDFTKKWTAAIVAANK